jgi:type I restriction-modification system DNA methylase subunit
MSARRKRSKQPKSTTANVGSESQLWQMADALHGRMDPAEYKHVVLDLIFLKYMSEAFCGQHAELMAEQESGEGRKGGEFYTPRCVVKLLVEMLEPYRGRVPDVCCGSSGMFVQSCSQDESGARYGALQ